MIKLFEPREFPDPVQTLRARQFHVLVISMMAIVTPFLVLIEILVPQRYPREMLFALSLNAVGVILLVLARHAFIKFSSVLFVTSLWLIVTVAAWTGGGIYAPSVSGYFFIPFLAALLLGTFAGVTALIIVILTGIGFIAAQSVGLLPASMLPTSPASVWAVHSMFLTMILTLCIVATGTLHHALGIASAELIGRKHKEEALRESEARLRAVFESSVDALGVAKKGIHIFANPSYLRLFGFENNEQIVGTSILDSIAPSHRKQVIQNVERRTAGEPIERFYESRCRRVDGTEFDAEFSLSTYMLNGEIYSVATIRDITERKQAEKTLRESEERFRQIAETIQDVFFLLDKHSDRILYVSPAIRLLLGVSPEEVMANRMIMRDAIHSDDLPRIQFIRPDVIYIAPIVEEFRLLKPPHREIRWVRLRSFLIRNEQGEIVRVAGLVTDITTVKMAEEKAQVQQRQLMQADKMTSLGILVSGVAHEINNPNNLVMFNGDLISHIFRDVTPVLDEYYSEHPDQKLGGVSYLETRDETEKLLYGINTGARRIRDIVAGLKEFARIDPGNLDQEVRINDVIHSALIIVGHLIRKSTDHFTLELDERVGSIRGNTQQIEQVVINLLTNACQALRNRSNAITLRSDYDIETGYAHIIVSDEGTGIRQEDMARLFDPFFTTKRDQGGTGLGLSVSYNIVRAHEGILKVESEIAKGTTVTLSLPVESTQENS